MSRCVAIEVPVTSAGERVALWGLFLGRWIGTTCFALRVAFEDEAGWKEVAIDFQNHPDPLLYLDRVTQALASSGQDPIREGAALLLAGEPAGPAETEASGWMLHWAGEVRLLARSDRMPPEALTRMADHFATLVRSWRQAVQEGKGLAVTRLSWLSPLQRERLLAWSGSEGYFPDGVGIHHLVSETARRSPDAIAVEGADGRTLSYRQLERRANGLAGLLRARGVGPDLLVGLCVERSPEMVIGLLAILKAGGAYVPLDPAYPQERLAFMFSEIETPLVLTRRSLVGQLPLEPHRALCVEEVTLEAEEAPPDVCFTAQRTAYVIFTSGSTGQPKGILLAHRGLCNLIHQSNRWFGMRPESRVLQFASPGFDVAVWEIFMALMAGATLVLAGGHTLFTLLEIPRTLKERRITLAMLPPSLLTVLAAEGLEGVSTLIAVGERCTNANVRRWAPGRAFFNGYGPAEGTVTATAHLTDVEEPELPLGPCIGRPLENVRVYLLDEFLQPVPVGVVGEIHLGGPCVAKGYLKRPELTRRKFIPDPFGEPGERLFRSGDLGRYLPDGRIEFLGRADLQVKIRGFRVELEEIETLLAREPGVQGAVVILRKRPGGGDVLVAYVVPARTGFPGGLQLVQAVTRQLPAYMAPTAVVCLDAFPLNPNGKIDRNALPPPEKEDWVVPKTSESGPSSWMSSFMQGV
ncbi:MAG: amino acid adenylation domain-containing protein [Magnetococcales bacterium]|nr:amino acid adenylation domain-containing protein [Magnetococcales bacterium]